MSVDPNLIALAAARDGLSVFVPDGIDTAVAQAIEEKAEEPKPSHYAEMLDIPRSGIENGNTPASSTERVAWIIERKVAAYREQLYAELEAFLDGDTLPPPATLYDQDTDPGEPSDSESE